MFPVTKYADGYIDEEFPLFTQQDFEVLLNHALWPIGIALDFPEELWKRLCAASVSYQLGNQSVDYYKRQYLAQHNYKAGQHARLDRYIQRSVMSAIKDYTETIQFLYNSRKESNVETTLGENVGNWTISRFDYSIGVAFSCANKGALYESLAIIRMNLEQLAWTCAIKNFDEFESIDKQSAPRSISQIKSLYNTAGEFYGWLSAHAHWKYDAHIKSFVFGPEKTSIKLASCAFKKTAFAAIIVFYDIFVAIMETIRPIPSTGAWPEREAAKLLMSKLVTDDQNTDIAHLAGLLATERP